MTISTARHSPKQDNNAKAFRAKVDIRQRVFDAVVAEAPRNFIGVFDAFAGGGAMHTAVWGLADHYVGCDLKRQTDGRLMFCADNRRVLRAIDLMSFNVFDLDAYGSPWHQAIIIADRRPVAKGELIGIVLTEGSGLSINVNKLPTAVSMLTGLKTGLVGVARRQDDIIDASIAGLARRMQCTVEKRWQADGRTSASMKYIGLVLRGH